MSKKSYWENFYSENHIMIPSPFADFATNYINNNDNVVEFGCGNGRDTTYLSAFCDKITGVDYASKPKPQFSDIKHIKSDINSFMDRYECLYDALYSRFFFHSIDDETIENILDWNQGRLIVEFRAKDDIPILYTDHYRNKVDENKVLKHMISKGYDVLYYIKTRGVAVYKGENPLVVRIVANRRIS